MKNKLIKTVFLGAMLVGLAACGETPTTVEPTSGSEPTTQSGSGYELTLWVGSESVEFYKSAAADFLTARGDAYAGSTISVIAADTGTAAAAMQNDNTACGDIITIAHDNIGKLAQSSLIYPLTDQNLLTQIDQDNPKAFKDVIKSTFGASDPTQYTFGVPYISQALMLFYNKALVTEDQAKSFEGLVEAGKANNSKSVAITGADGYNFSFSILAGTNEGYETSLKLYKEELRDQEHTYFQGDDMIANTKWAQRMFADPNGLMWPTDSGWTVEVKNGGAVGIIGGAWHKNSFIDAVGEENVGITLIPTFTLTEADVAGTTVAANTVMRGGTFADCKCFVLNAAVKEAAKRAMAQDFMAYLSSKVVQNASFKAAGNVPAYEGAAEYIETIREELDPIDYQMAVAQTSMGSYGIAQPFLTGKLNSYYYSMGAPALYQLVLVNDGTDKVDGNPVDYNDVNSIRQAHFRIEYIWRKGKDPVTISGFEWPTSYPSDF